MFWKVNAVSVIYKLLCVCLLSKGREIVVQIHVADAHSHNFKLPLFFYVTRNGYLTLLTWQVKTLEPMASCCKSCRNKQRTRRKDWVSETQTSEQYNASVSYKRSELNSPFYFKICENGMLMVQWKTSDWNKMETSDENTSINKFWLKMYFCNSHFLLFFIPHKNHLHETSIDPVVQRKKCLTEDPEVDV